MGLEQRSPREEEKPKNVEDARSAAESLENLQRSGTLEKTASNFLCETLSRPLLQQRKFVSIGSGSNEQREPPLPWRGAPLREAR